MDDFERDRQAVLNHFLQEAEERRVSFEMKGWAVINGVRFSQKEWDMLADICIDYVPQEAGQSDEDYRRQCTLAGLNVARDALRWQRPVLTTQRKPFWRSWTFYAAMAVGSFIIIKLLEN